MSLPETLCPRCGVGELSGRTYPSCVDFPTPETRAEAHARLCKNFGVNLCDACEKDIEEEAQSADPAQG